MRVSTSAPTSFALHPKCETRHNIFLNPVRGRSQVLSVTSCSAGDYGECFFVSTWLFPTYGLRCGFRNCRFLTKVHSVSRTHVSKAETKLHLSLDFTRSRSVSHLPFYHETLLVSVDPHILNTYNKGAFAPLSFALSLQNTKLNDPLLGLTEWTPFRFCK